MLFLLDVKIASQRDYVQFSKVYLSKTLSNDLYQDSNKVYWLKLVSSVAFCTVAVETIFVQMIREKIKEDIICQSVSLV